MSTSPACTGRDTGQTQQPAQQATASTSATATMPIPDIATATYDPSLGVTIASFTRTPHGLYYQDMTVGTGAEAVAGTVVRVHYLGRLTNGTRFDSNQPGQEPYPFQVGAGSVVAGFEQGVIGMKAGGKRMIIIPPSMGYGAAQMGPIPPNSIMVFVMDLVSVNRP